MPVDFTIVLKDDASAPTKEEPSARTILNEMEQKPSSRTILNEADAPPSARLNQYDKDKDAGAGVTSARKIIQALDEAAALLQHVPVIRKAASGPRRGLAVIRKAMDVHKRLSGKDAAERQPSRAVRAKAGPQGNAQPAGAEAGEAPEAAEGAEAAGVGQAAAGIGLGGIAVVAAPIAAVVLAAKAAAVGLETLTGGAREAAEEMSQFASNNNVKTLANVTDTAAASLRAIPVVGKDLENTVKNVTATFTAVDTAARSFVERGQQLAGFSGPLSQSNAMAEVRSLMADIREANDLGPEIAKLTDAQSQFDAELRDALLPVKQVIVEILTEVIEELRAWMPEIKDILHQSAIWLEEIDLLVSILARQNQEEIMKKFDRLAHEVGEVKNALNKPKSEKTASLQAQIARIGVQAFPQFPAFNQAPPPVFGPVGL